MTETLLTLIRELQAVEQLHLFSLAGGTNLAIRFNHRKSIDIDLFTNTIVGTQGWKNIEQSIRNKYGSSVLFCDIINEDLGDQFCFLRALIQKNGEQVKIDMIQNVQRLDAIETVNGMNLFTIRDIGLYKLMAASNRFAKKDIYDLDLITDYIDLTQLLQSLEVKLAAYSAPGYECLFDLDHEKNPLEDITVLLKFDVADKRIAGMRHTHSSDRLDILENGKSWLSAKSSWRRKVRNLQS